MRNGEVKLAIPVELARGGRAALRNVRKWSGPAIASRVEKQFAKAENFTAQDVCRAVFQARLDLAETDVKILAEVGEMQFTSQVKRVETR